jgi:large subunit ribosomal protein L2
MGKRITQQARGKGSLTFRVRPRAYKHKISYPPIHVEGKAKITKLFSSAGHSAPLVEIKIDNLKFIVPAAEGIFESQEIYIGKRDENQEPKIGDILKLNEIEQGTNVFNIESIPGNGGRLLRSAGSSAVVVDKRDKIEIQIRRRRLKLHGNCRGVIGVVAGDGRLIKPIIKAGKRHHQMKAIGRKWHRTSAVKVNAVDHPFGSGRGKRIKSKIAKRNSPPGLKVGHIRPKRTGKK